MAVRLVELSLSDLGDVLLGGGREAAAGNEEGQEDVPRSHFSEAR